MASTTRGSRGRRQGRPTAATEEAVEERREQAENAGGLKGLIARRGGQWSVEVEDGLLRRTQRRQGLGRLRAGPLELDPPSREVSVRGVRVELSQKEFSLLRTLVSDPTRVFTKEELLRGVWGFRALGSTRTLDSHACRLRHKLGAHGDRFVVNVWGVGYRLVEGPVGT